MRSLFAILVASLLISLVTASCSDNCSTLLATAESLMTERPDSALSILESVDGSRLSGEQQARHALLLSRAYDKNYINITSDSLISIATGYYNRHGDERHRMMALFYQGVVQYNVADYSNCIVNLSKAEKIAFELDDYFYLGRIYTTMGDLYNSTYNAEEQVRCRKLAVANFKKVPDSDYYLWSLLDLATAYTDIGMPEKCIEILDSLGSDNDINSDFKTDRIDAAISPLVQLGHYDEALMKIDSLKRLNYDYLSAGNYLNLIKCHLYFGNTDSVKYYLAKMNKTDFDNNALAIDLAWISYCEDKGDFKSAFERLRNANIHQDSIVGEVLRQSVMRAQYNYYSQEAKRIEKDRKSLLTYAVLAIGCAVFILIILILFFRYRIRRKNREIGRIMSEAEEFSKTVFYQKDLISAMKEKLDEQQKELVNLYLGVETMYGAQFKIIDDICYQYFENMNSDKVKHYLYLEVMKNIEAMRNPKYINELEGLVNKFRFNVISKLRSQFPKMKETDIKFLVYMFAGLSLRSICLFMNITIGNYYNKRTRLKAKIMSSDVPDKDLFLSMF